MTQIQNPTFNRKDFIQYQIVNQSGYDIYFGINDNDKKQMYVDSLCENGLNVKQNMNSLNRILDNQKKDIRIESSN